MNRLQLDEAELQSVDSLVQRLTDRFDRIDDPELLAETPLIAHELPLRIRRLLHRLHREEIGWCIIGGHPVDDSAIGPTPAHWNTNQHPSPVLSYEILLLLYTSLLGAPFGWATQQDGRLVHDVMPIKGNEKTQLGTGSEMLLTWHTEDAFHPYRGDYVVLACLRNPQTAGTTMGRVDDLELDREDVDILFQQRFVILPDESHRPQHNSTDGATDFGSIESMLAQPPAVAVLFGGKDEPYIRADPYFMQVRPDDEPAECALRHLTAEMDARMQEVALAPGDYCFIDNFKVVHGRKPFTARFDGTDRWLKRVCITRDLRKSRDARAHSTSFTIR